jgi:hypothetical protein
MFGEDSFSFKDFEKKDFIIMVISIPAIVGFIFVFELIKSALI